MVIRTGGTTRINEIGEFETIATAPSVNDAGSHRFCRSYVNFNGTTNPLTFRGFRNVMSITDLGTGRFQINFNTAAGGAMIDANYAVVGSARRGDGAPDLALSLGLSSGAFSTSAVEITTHDCSNGAAVNPTFCCVAVYR